MSISSLEAELSRQRAINRELRQELSQIESGAFYPATVEAWQNAELIVNGNVVQEYTVNKE